MTNPRKGEANGGCGCVSCLCVIILIWLAFYGGCSKMNDLIDSQIRANNAKAATQSENAKAMSSENAKAATQSENAKAATSEKQ